MTALFDTTRPPAVERLARIEGQSNFLSLMAGIEAGPDTTEDMAAQSFARARGAVPEVLEVYVAQSGIYRLPLMSMVFAALREELKPKDEDVAWMQGAVADAFLLIRYGHCKRSQDRARKFKVQKTAYQVVRKTAYAVMWEMVDRAERAWSRARYAREPGITGKCHATHTEIGTRADLRAMGQSIAPKLIAGGPDAMNGFQAKAVGIRDRLAWDDRHAAPSSVTEYKPGA